MTTSFHDPSVFTLLAIDNRDAPHHSVTLHSEPSGTIVFKSVCYYETYLFLSFVMVMAPSCEALSRHILALVLTLHSTFSAFELHINCELAASDDDEYN